MGGILSAVVALHRINEIDHFLCRLFSTVCIFLWWKINLVSLLFSVVFYINAKRLSLRFVIENRGFQAPLIGGENAIDGMVINRIFIY